MGGIFSATKQIPYLLSDYITEKFIHSAIPYVDDSGTGITIVRNSNSFSMDPDTLMTLLMSNPHLVTNISDALEYLINYNQSMEMMAVNDLSGIFIDFDKTQRLADSRLITIDTKSYGRHIVKQSGSLIELCTILFSIIQSIEYDEMEREQFARIIGTFPQTPYFVPPRPEMIIDNSNYVGILSTHSLIVRGLACNGNFIFTLSHDMVLNVFPMLENGSLLPPFSRTIELHHNDGASLIVTNNSLVIWTFHKIYFYDLAVVTERTDKRLVHTHTRPPTTERSLAFSDGVVTVIVDRTFKVRIYPVGSDEMIHYTMLREGNSPVSPLIPDLFAFLFHQLESNAVEVNGTFLSIFIRIGDSRVLIRQFSLLNGKHITDELIESPLVYSSVTYDSINRLHWVAGVNNGRIHVRAFQSCGVINPFIFGFKPVYIHEADKVMDVRIANLFENLTLHLLSSMCYDVPDHFRFTDWSDVERAIGFIVNMLEMYATLPETKLPQFLYVLQIMVILTGLNARLFFEEGGKETSRIQEQLVFLMMKIPAYLSNDSSLGFSAFLLIWLCDKMDSRTLADLFVEIIAKADPGLFRYAIGQLSKYKSLVSIPVMENNEFSKALQYGKKRLPLNLLTLFMTHQKVLVRETLRFLKSDLFYSIKSGGRIPNENAIIDHFSNYAQILVNQVPLLFSSASSFSEVKSSSTFLLFNNFITLIWSLSDFHTIAQIILPLIIVLPAALKRFFERIHMTPDGEASDIFRRVGFTFGLFAGTLIKGGDFSAFEKKYNWLIWPNMYLVDKQDELAQLESSCNWFPSPEITKFVMYGDSIMEGLYKTWKPSMNRKLSDELKRLDKLSLAALVSQTGTIDDLLSFELEHVVRGSLRPLLEQMSRIRNCARADIRNGKSITDYFTKCRMIARMKTRFQVCQCAPKLIANFVVSSDSGASIVHFIRNQRVRLNLTRVGFSFIESMFKEEIGSAFSLAVSVALARIDNFDGLASIFRYSKNTPLMYVNSFISRVIDENKSFLLIVVYKLFSSGIISNGDIGAFISRVVKSLKENVDPRLFGLCYGRIGYIGNILTMYQNISEMSITDWYLVADALQTTECSLSFYEKYFEYLLVCPVSVADGVIRAIYEIYKNSTLDTTVIIRDLTRILERIGRLLCDGVDLEIAVLLVKMFRLMLAEIEKLKEVIYAVLKAVTPESQETMICGVFAVLGGSFDVLMDNCNVYLHPRRDKIVHAILVGSVKNQRLFEIPITPEAKAIHWSNERIYPETSIPFRASMFPFVDFVLGFFDIITSNIYSLSASLYMSSLAHYITEYASEIPSSLVEKMIRMFTNVMNPIDSIQMTIDMLHLQLKKHEDDLFCGFTPLKHSGSDYIVYTSEAITGHRVMNVRVHSEQDFSGYIGFIEDTLHISVPHVLVELPNATTFPSRKKLAASHAKVVDFTVNLHEKVLVFGSEKISFPRATSENSVFRIIVAVKCNIQLVKIDVFGDEFSNDHDPVLSLIGDNMKADSERLFQIPEWAKGSCAYEMLNNMKNLPKYESCIPDCPEGCEVFEEAPLCLHIMRAENSSRTIKKWILKVFSAQLYSQWATVIVMKLVLAGYYKSLTPSAAVRLFSLLLVAIEPYEDELLEQAEFPFSLDCSVLDEHAEMNCLNYGLEIPAQRALRLIVKQPEFADYLKLRIHQMNALPSVHFMTDHVAVQYQQSLDVSVSPVWCDFMIISTPVFNQIMSSDKAVHGSDKKAGFPIIIRNCSKTSFKLQQWNFPIAVVPIPKVGNGWIYGSIFEMLILMKQYMMMRSDPMFVRQIIIDNILVQSPFSWTFMNQFLLHSAQNFIGAADMTSEYVSYLAMLGSFITTKESSIDHRVISFFVQEKRSMSSNMLTVLSPHFPEFGVVAHEPVASKDVTVVVVSPDVPNPIDDPIGLFLLYKSFISERKSIKGFPFWDVLPIWLGLTTTWSIDYQKLHPFVEVQSDNTTIRILNPSRSASVVSISANIILENDAFILVSRTKTLESAQKIRANDSGCQIKFTGFEIYLRLVGIPGGASSISISVELIPEEEETRSITMKIDIGAIHDDFIREMEIFVTKWTPFQTQALLTAFPSYMFEQLQFSVLKESIIESGIIYGFPERVVLFVTHLLHVFNYLYKFHRNKIPDCLWKSVLGYISSEEAAVDFMASIQNSHARSPELVINRHEAHRVILDNTYRSNMTVIAQFANRIKNVDPENMRNKANPWYVTFRGESAIDAGGPQRELFSEIASSIFEPTSGLFILAPNGRYNCGAFRDVYVPSNSVGRNGPAQYYAIGVYIGMVIRSGLSQNLPFAPLVWKFLANERLSEDDILLVDERLKMHVQRLLNAQDDPDFAEKFALQWTVEDWDGSIIQLKHSVVHGRDVREYISLCIKKRLDSITPYLTMMQKGFHDNIGFSRHKCMHGTLLSLLAQGSNVVTTTQLKRITTFINFEGDDRGVSNFWAAIERMTNEQRAQLLRFISTLMRLPNPRINHNFRLSVSKMEDADDTRLPCASTCLNRLYLPSYSTSDIAFDKIILAIESCQTMENA